VFEVQERPDEKEARLKQEQVEKILREGLC